MENFAFSLSPLISAGDLARMGRKKVVMYVQDIKGALYSFKLSRRGAVLLGPLLEPLHPALPLLLPLDQQRLPLQHEALLPLPLRRVVPLGGKERS